jgi:hypothetical protein
MLVARGRSNISFNADGYAARWFSLFHRSPPQGRRSRRLSWRWASPIWPACVLVDFDLDI